MRRASTAIACLLLIAALGCAKDPGRRWIQSSAVATSVNETVTDLNAIGSISDEQLLELRPTLNTMNDTVDRAHDRLPQGGSAFDALLDAFNAAYNAYLRQLQEMQ